MTQYLVIRDFVDADGKQWKTGKHFTGDETQARAALAADNVRELDPHEPSASREGFHIMNARFYIMNMIKRS